MELQENSLSERDKTTYKTSDDIRQRVVLKTQRETVKIHKIKKKK